MSITRGLKPNLTLSDLENSIRLNFKLCQKNHKNPHLSEQDQTFYYGASFILKTLIKDYFNQ